MSILFQNGANAIEFLISVLIDGNKVGCQNKNRFDKENTPLYPTCGMKN